MGATEDRRGHGSVDAPTGTLWVELATYDLAGSRVDLRGNVVSLSRQGVRVRIDRQLGEGIGCLVHFVGTRHGVRPAYVLGRVVRCRVVDGGHEAEIEFEKPVDAIPAS